MSAAGSSPIDVLVVDDDDVDRLAVARVLSRCDVPARVSEATSADDALALLERGAFACAIVDMRMPGHDGEWLVREARARGVTTPFVVLTGHGCESTAVELMKAGASDYLSKADLSTERLGRSLRHVLRVCAAETEARRAFDELRRSERRLKAALDVASLGTFERDLESGELACDARCKEIFGFAPHAEPDLDAMRGRIVAEDRASLSALAAEVEREPNGGGNYEATFRVRGCDGEERWVKTTAQVTMHDGRVRRVLGVVKDITTQRRYEEHRARQVELEQELIGIVSHDLRNPITAMMLSASALLPRTQGDAAVQRGLARIVSSGERATRMVRDLLDFTRARVGGGIPIESAACDLHDIARTTIDEVLAGFPARAVDHEPIGDGHGRWDGDRLAQVVGNLVANALAYSPEDTPVTVRTRGEDECVLLEVENAGEPIDPALLPTLFEPFRRGGAKASARSVGLGLYIVSQIVVAHGGRHEVTSTAERGTTFRVWLPRAHAARA